MAKSQEMLHNRLFDMQTNLSELLANLGMSSTYLRKNVLGPVSFVFSIFLPLLKCNWKKIVAQNMYFSNNFKPLDPIMKVFLLEV